MRRVRPMTDTDLTAAIDNALERIVPNTRHADSFTLTINPTNRDDVLAGFPSPAPAGMIDTVYGRIYLATDPQMPTGQIWLQVNEEATR
jgi:hypothetical protein